MLVVVLAACGQQTSIDPPPATCATPGACSGPKPLPPPDCSTTGDCQCSSEGSCCPGQTCSKATGACMDAIVACSGDADCTGAAQHCLPLDSRQNKGCTYDLCAGSTCPAGRACFNRYCVAEPPCGGGCGGEQVCVVATNRCFDPSEALIASCHVTCPPGTMKVLENPLNIFAGCTMTIGDCTCAPLPSFAP